MSEKQTTSKKKPAGKAVKIGANSYDLVVAEALRLGVQRGEIITIQQVVDELVQKHLSGKPKPELKE